MTEPLVIYGNGQMAELAWACFRRQSRYEIRGFTVDSSLIRCPTIFGLPLVPFEEVERHFSPDAVHIFIAVGPVRANRIRSERFAQARRSGYRFASYVSERAWVDPDVRLGENCSIGENAIIQAFSQIGDNVRVGSASAVGHHCVIEDHCFVGTSCAISGSVRIESHATIGANATIRDRVNIGAGCLIGVGATIVRDTVANSVHAAPEAVVLPISADRIRL